MQRCAIIQHESVHEAVIPTFIYCLNKADISVDVYLNENIKLKFGDIFENFTYDNCAIHYVKLDGRKDWELLADAVLVKEPDFVIANTFQRRGVMDWTISLGIPILAVVHNIARFIENKNDIDLSLVFQFITLAEHVKKNLIKSCAEIGEGDVDYINPVIWPVKNVEVLNESELRIIAVPGGVNFQDRDYGELVKYFVSNPGSKLKIFIIGGGKDRDKLIKWVHDCGVQNNFEFTPLDDSGFVPYSSFIKALNKCSFVDGLIPDTTSYRTERITSAVSTAIGFCKPIYQNSVDFKCYGVVSLDHHISRVDFLKFVEGVTLSEYKYQKEVFSTNLTTSKHLACNVIKNLSKGSIVLSSRSDGLTERINSIFNGKLLANKHDLAFRYCWPRLPWVDNDNIIKATVPDFINSKFIDDYFLPLEYVQEHAPESLVVAGKKRKLITHLNVVGDFKYSKYKYLSPVHRCSSESIGKLTNQRFEFIKSFFSVNFLDKVEFFKTNLSFDISSCTAIHYRGGDVIYGKFRYGNHVIEKSLSLPVIEAMINSSCSDFILFGTPIGETLNDLKYLDDKYSRVLLAMDLIPISDCQSENVLLECFLMSYCHNVICASSSGVTQLAALLSEKKLIVNTPSLSEQYVLLNDIVNKGLPKNYSNLQNAFIYFNLFVFSVLNRSHSKEYLLKILKYGYEADNENVAFLLIMNIMSVDDECDLYIKDSLMAFDKKFIEHIKSNLLSLNYIKFLKLGN